MRNGFVTHLISMGQITIVHCINKLLTLFWDVKIVVLTRVVVIFLSTLLPPEDYNEENLNDAAVYLYGMIHARYIITTEGMELMVLVFSLCHKQEEKFCDKDFGCCQRTYCNEHPLLPVGLSNKPNVDSVKLFCPCCKEIYNPPVEFQGIDGAFFGTTFAHMFLLQFPQYLASPAQHYEPTVFGFKIHPSRYALFLIWLQSPYYIESEKKKKEEEVSSV